MKWRGKILVGIAVAIALGVLWPILLHWRAKAPLDVYCKQLAAQGEKLTVGEAAPHLTADEMESAHALLAACSMLGSTVSNYPPFMHVLTPGRALVPWREEDLPTDGASNLWPELRAQIQGHGRSLDGLRKALKQPIGELNLDYSQGVMLLLPHLAPAKASAVWLAASAELELHDGLLTNAFEDLTNGVALCRVFQREPLEISQLVRIAINQIVLGRTWDALQHPGWRDAQLAQLQASWESLDELNGMEHAVVMERNLMAMTFDMARSNDPDVMTGAGGAPGHPNLMDVVGEFMANPRQGYQSFMDRYPRYWAWKWQWSYEEELYYMQVIQTGLESFRKLRTNNSALIPFLKEYAAAETNLLKPYGDVGVNKTFMMNFYVGPIKTFFRKAVTMEIERRLLVTAIALKRFQLAHGKYPNELKELMPAFLAAVPLDAMDGKPLRYHPKPDGTFLLYSVGQDGVDNGGDPTPTSNGQFWTEAKDVVWPMPATPEEVQAYKKKLVDKWMAKQAGKKPDARSRRLTQPAKAN